MKPKQLLKAVEHSKSTANIHRVIILEALSKGPKYVGELEKALKIKGPALTTHLEKLVKAGKVTMEKQGVKHIYTIGKGVWANYKFNLEMEGIL